MLTPRVMIAVRQAASVLGLLAGMAAPAYALKPSAHADITMASCLASQLPKNFCHRVATEDYDTDAREWDDLTAHAQIDDAETACDAADHTAEHAWLRADELRVAFDAVTARATEDNVGDAATALGRALHTIQDNCAHHGMPNPQHAWFSLEDFCDGTRHSPDVQGDALACARTETDAVMRLVATKVQQLGIARPLSGYSCPEVPDRNDHGGPSRTVCEQRFLPGPIDACKFLGRADDWDGTDRQWESDVVVPALRDGFAAGLAGHAPIAPMCQGDEQRLSPAVSEPIVDVTDGAPSCFRAHLLCFGAADGDEHPFADEETPSVDEVGCNAGGGSGSGLAVVLAMLGVGLRRRRR